VPLKLRELLAKDTGPYSEDHTFSKNALRTPDLAWFPVGNECLNSRGFSMHNL